MAPINFLEDTTPKWKIVAAVGGACIVGAGVYYYFNKKSEDEPEALAEKKVSPSGNGSAVYNVDVSIVLVISIIIINGLILPLYPVLCCFKRNLYY